MTRTRGSRWVVLLVLVAITLIPVFALGPFGIGVPVIRNLISAAGIVVYIGMWAAIIAGGIWLARELGWLDRLVPSGRDAALEDLRRRYARGEITRAEYFQTKQDLEAES